MCDFLTLRDEDICPDAVIQTELGFQTFSTTFEQCWAWTNSSSKIFFLLLPSVCFFKSVYNQTMFGIERRAEADVKESRTHS